MDQFIGGGSILQDKKDNLKSDPYVVALWDAYGARYILRCEDRALAASCIVNMFVEEAESCC